MAHKTIYFISWWLFFTLCLISKVNSQTPSGKIKDPIPLTAFQAENIKIYLQKSSEFEKASDFKEATRYLNMAGTIYWENFQYDAALELFLRSVSLNDKLDNESGMSMIYNNVAMLYSDKADYENSLKYFSKCLDYRRKTKEKIGMIATLINLSVVLNNLKQWDRSIQNLEEALVYAKELNDLEQIRLCYGMLSETYEKAGNTEKSLYYFNYYRSIHDLLSKSKVEKAEQKAFEQEIRNKELEIDKKNKEIELLKKQEELSYEQAQISHLYDTLSKQEVILRLIKNESEKKAAEADKQKAVSENEKIIRRVSIFAIIIVLIVFSLIFINRFQRTLGESKIEEQKKEIETLRNVIFEMGQEIENLKQTIY